MTEKNKMLVGQLYQAYDPQLTDERKQTKELLHRYNTLAPSDTKQRKTIIEKLFGKIEGTFLIEQPFHCDYGYNIRIGKNFYANVNCVILDEAPVTIGDNVLLAPNVGIYTAGHPEDVLLRSRGYEYAYPVTIGNDVWIGAGVSITPGVVIGDGTIIGAGSVVTHDIPPGVIAAGNPCKIIRPLKQNEKR